MIFISLSGLILAFGLWFHLTVSTSKPAAVWFQAKGDDNRSVFLPEDDAPHTDKIEWWYYNGHLTSESGKQFSFHYCIFLINGMMTHTIAQVSLADHQTKKHYLAQRRTGGNPSLGTFKQFQFTLRDWQMKGGNGEDRLHAVTDQFSFDLQLSSHAAPVLHGRGGIISLGAAGDSYYYSRERMAITGTLKTGKTDETVHGLAWFDHQWGNFSIGQLGWDWFSLQMDNGTDIMIYQLRDRLNKPVLYTGSVTQNGNTEILSNDDFIMIPGHPWVSKKTGIRYPLTWHIKIPDHNIDITTRSIINDSEFDARLTTYNVYWEGAVEVKGSHHGKGFMELSGY